MLDYHSQYNDMKICDCSTLCTTIPQLILNPESKTLYVVVTKNDGLSTYKYVVLCRETSYFVKKIIIRNLLYC